MEKGALVRLHGEELIDHVYYYYYYYYYVAPHPGQVPGSVMLKSASAVFTISALESEANQLLKNVEVEDDTICISQLRMEYTEDNAVVQQPLPCVVVFVSVVKIRRRKDGTKLRLRVIYFSSVTV